jgi:hypothetical protein
MHGGPQGDDQMHGMSLHQAYANRVRQLNSLAHASERRSIHSQDVHNWPVFAAGSVWTESVLDVMTIQVRAAFISTVHCSSSILLACCTEVL